ncbi:MAG: alpha/beta hydrolase [Dehalococcoidia bacterium]|nr:alpha/beta hydrolase [Dehalococcoidia bacterium]
MKPQQIVFPCGEIKLEGLFYSVEASGSAPAVVVCHPHPLYGGTMHNNVTYAIADALVKSGITALLFNFRGVGRSQGSYGGGIEEQQDVKAALDWLGSAKGVDGDRLGLAGYSFGAGVAFPVGCGDARVKAIALVSPYFESSPVSLFKGCLKPKLLMGGSQDDMVPPGDVEAYGREAAEPGKCEIIKGPDHFWGGYEGAMAEKVAGFFKDNL